VPLGATEHPPLARPIAGSFQEACRGKTRDEQASKHHLWPTSGEGLHLVEHILRFRVAQEGGDALQPIRCFSCRLGQHIGLPAAQTLRSGTCRLSILAHLACKGLLLSHEEAASSLLGLVGGGLYSRLYLLHRSGAVFTGHILDVLGIEFTGMPRSALQRRVTTTLAGCAWLHWRSSYTTRCEWLFVHSLFGIGFMLPGCLQKELRFLLSRESPLRCWRSAFQGLPRCKDCQKADIVHLRRHRSDAALD